LLGLGNPVAFLDPFQRVGERLVYVENRSADELAALRVRADFARQIEDRVATMTPTERRQFDTLMKRAASAKR
jgi:hypothetical protein